MMGRGAPQAILVVLGLGSGAVAAAGKPSPSRGCGRAARFEPGLKEYSLKLTDPQGLPSVARECELQDTLKTTCSWDRYLFNVTHDQTERTNLYNDPRYAEARAEIESYVEERVGELAVFEDAYAGMSGKETRALKTTMGEAFYAAGGYVVPWGCEAVE